jgi:hypothetical protein
MIIISFLGWGFIGLVLAFNMAQWRAELRTAAM